MKALAGIFSGALWQAALDDELLAEIEMQQSQQSIPVNRCEPENDDEIELTLA